MQISYKGHLHTLRKNEAIRFLNEDRMAFLYRVVTTNRTYFVLCSYHLSSGTSGKYTSRLMHIDEWWSEVLWQKGDTNKKKQYIAEQVKISRSCFPELPQGINDSGRLEFSVQEIQYSGIFNEYKN